jgi:cytochrome c-550 PedF
MTMVKFGIAAIAGGALLAGLLGTMPRQALAHGDVTPQLVDITGLDPLGADWRKENPYGGNKRALEVGATGYGANCARCHGLQVISGGIAPDLRYLEKGKIGDEWFIERIRHGAKNQDGASIMPAFEGLIQQEAMWAIRTYVESQHQD